jgi:hypothetical protein
LEEPEVEILRKGAVERPVRTGESEESGTLSALLSQEGIVIPKVTEAKERSAENDGN